MFTQLIEEGFLDPLDLYFADLHHPADQAEKAFFAAVMRAARQGHLCLDLQAFETPKAALAKEWKELVLQGAEKKPTSPYLIFEHPFVYLEKNYRYETDIIHELKRLQKNLPLPQIDPIKTLTLEQQTAFNLVRAHSLSIVEGGPGTGKTHLASELIKSFGPESRVILTAPTGKAVSRLKEKNQDFPCLSGTLHSILKLRPYDLVRREATALQADLIIVDEASMIDAKIMTLLLRSIPDEQRVVFLGDGNQLPPIESGNLFRDLIDLIPTAHLHTCLRSDRKELLHLAELILKGHPPKPNAQLMYDAILEFSLAHSQKIPHNLRWDRAAILTPLREGEWGVKQLNLKIEEAHRTKLPSQAERVVPILITRNDPETSLSNGDMGALIYASGKPQYALFETAQHGSYRLNLSQLPPYELAYVLSVHKSQGSEFDHVLVLVPPGTELFGRELLYTAVTRARKTVTLYGDQATVDQTVLYSSRKHSGLKHRFGAI